MDVTLNYRFTSHLSGYLITSAVSYDRGFLDGAVERFHDAFALSSYGRPAIARNGVNLIYDLKSSSYASLGRAPTNGGLLDPTIGMRYSGIPLGRSWQLSFEGAVKLALDGERAIVVDRPVRLRPAGGRAVARCAPGFLRQCSRGVLRGR